MPEAARNDWRRLPSKLGLERSRNHPSATRLSKKECSPGSEMCGCRLEGQCESDCRLFRVQVALVVGEDTAASGFLPELSCIRILIVNFAPECGGHIKLSLLSTDRNTVCVKYSLYDLVFKRSNIIYSFSIDIFQRLGLRWTIIRGGPHRRKNRNRPATSPVHRPGA